MKKHLTKVKCYRRPKAKQFLITITGEHDFKKDEPVYIVRAGELDELLKNHEVQVKELKEKADVLSNDMDRLRGKMNHISERFIKSQDEVIKLERALSSMFKLSLWDRLRGKIPEDVKLLE